MLARGGITLDGGVDTLYCVYSVGLFFFTRPKVSLAVFRAHVWRSGVELEASAARADAAPTRARGVLREHAARQPQMQKPGPPLQYAKKAMEIVSHCHDLIESSRYRIQNHDGSISTVSSALY